MIQDLDLNLATRPFRNNTLLWVGHGVAVALLVLFTSWNIKTYGQYSDRLADKQLEVGSLEQRFADLERRERETVRAIGQFDLRSLRTRTGKANEFILWKSFSWTRLFNLLQDVLPHRVQMVSVRPMFRSRGGADDSGRDSDGSVQIALEGLAKKLPDFFELETALLDDPHFDRVEPQAISTDDMTGETLFQLRVQYHPHVVEKATEELVAEDLEAAEDPGTVVDVEEPPQEDLEATDDDIAALTEEEGDVAQPSVPEAEAEDAQVPPTELAAAPTEPAAVEEKVAEEIKPAPRTSVPERTERPTTKRGRGGRRGRRGDDDSGAAAPEPQDPGGQPR